MKSNSVQFLGGHPVFKVDLHFAINLWADRHFATAFRFEMCAVNEIVPYKEDLNICKNYIM
jgi:hypothetical protein